MDIQAQVSQVLEHDTVARPSFFALKYFILGKEPTIQAKLWCCVRELRSRKEAMDALQLEMEEIADNKELLQIKIDRLEDQIASSTFDDREKTVMCRKYSREMYSLDVALQRAQRTLKATEEEAAFLVNAFKKLEEKEPLKPFDDLESQTAYYNERFRQKMDLSILLQRPLDTQLVTDILLLEDEVPVKNRMLVLLNNIRNQALAQAKKATLKLNEEQTIPPLIEDSQNV